MEELFKLKLKEERASENRLGTALSSRQYNVLVSKVLAARLNKSHKLNCEHLLLEKYEVIEEGTSQRLIVPDSSPHIYYVHDDELFPILMEGHMATGHGNRNKMMTHLRETYKNISYQDVIIFLSLCKGCVQKNRLSNEKDKRRLKFNRHCLIEIIDYQCSPDGDYNFILVYKELFTKFLILKPLKTKGPGEIADNLINIFGILAPPVLLQSDCGPKFLDDVIDILKILWPSLNLKRSESCDVSKDSTAEEIENMITTWMRNNLKSMWSEGIRFVQLKYNTTVHDDINVTPYEALFKHSVTVGAEARVEYEAQVQMEEEEDESSLQIKEEVMDICKTEMKNRCENCGKELEDEEECDVCRDDKSDAKPPH